MIYSRHIAAIRELSASEGVFTTSQAKRIGIPRDALAHAHKAGRIERVCHGAYRLVGAQTRETDDLAAIWKLTDATRFTWERQHSWDGICIGGITAASLQDMGDFFMSPYQIYAPKRINSRIENARFSKREIAGEDVTWRQGLPLTKPERTLVDLCLDQEDPSLITSAFCDAETKRLDFARLEQLAEKAGDTPRKRKALELLVELVHDFRGGKT